ncbi:hypothetical protein ACHAXR_005139 [Thalassiosira sp. AJA248-18]
MKAFVIHEPSQTSTDNDDDDDCTMGNPLDNGKLITDVPIPTIPSPTYALIQILRAGICNTDLEILQGYMGFTGTLGHEFVGNVVALHDDVSSDVREKWMGKRVCGDINLGCCNNSITQNDNTTTSAANNFNYCGVCNDSLGYNSNHSQMSRNHCPNRTVLGILNQDGTFCEYMLLPIRNLHHVPANVPDEIAVFAEPLAAACRVVEQGLVHFRYDDNAAGSATRGGDRVAILGDGKLGLCVAEILGREYLRCCLNKGGDCIKKTPPPPILFGKHKHKLDLVKESGVQTHLVSSCYGDEKQEQISPNHMNQYDVVIDATGNPNGLSLSMSLCRPMGKLVLKSTCASGVKGFHSAPIVIDELMVVGSRCGPIDVALDLLEDNSTEASENDGIPPLRMEKYITRTFPLSEVREALEFAALKSTMKVQLVMTGG